MSAPAADSGDFACLVLGALGALTLYTLWHGTFDIDRTGQLTYFVAMVIVGVPLALVGALGAVRAAPPRLKLLGSATFAMMFVELCRAFAPDSLPFLGRVLDAFEWTYACVAVGAWPLAHWRTSTARVALVVIAILVVALAVTFGWNARRHRFRWQDTTAGPSELRLMHAIAGQDAATVKRLLDEGADPDAIAAGGWSAVLVAAQVGDEGLLSMLLDAGGNANARENYIGSRCPAPDIQPPSCEIQILLDGDTALIIAARGNHVAAVSALLAHGADPMLTNGSRMTAADHARTTARNPTLEALLRNAGTTARRAVPPR